MPFVAILGLAGVGKTTVARQLAKTLGGRAFCEPDRREWPSFIEDGFVEHAFDVLEWFRCYQVNAIRSAAAFGEYGLAICDAYYHKTMIGYVHHPSSEWIIPKSDPYFSALEKILELDANRLPNADLIIFLSVKHDQWRKMVRSRAQQGDDILLASAFASQEPMLHATEKHAFEVGIPMIHIQQQYGQLDDAVVQCSEFIKENIA
ncbi:MAG: hypothetical protein AAFQ10_03940 [Pseudomonadota bacterium]